MSLKDIVKHCLLLFLLLMVSGCIGSTMFTKDPEINKDFPDIHQTPERTKAMDFNYQKSTIAEAKEAQIHAQEWEDNLKLRRKEHLKG